MRLFVAVDLDDHVRQAAGRIMRELRARIEGVAVSWVGPDNYHLTLRFLGEVDDEAAREIQARLTDPFTLAPFDVALAGVGVFPPTGASRVVWLGVTEGMDALAQLHQQVERRLPAQFPPEDRPYRAHLTIGRFRVPAPARVRDTLLERPVGTIGRCRVDRVTLYRSQLSPKGAIYTPLVRAGFAGAA